MKRLPFPLIVALLLFVLVFAVAGRLSTPPPKDADAPPNEFSAARAIGQLEYLLGDQQPHPTGTPANDRVRERLVQRLVELGFTPEVQQAIGCSARWPLCGRVANVLAGIPGTEDSAILLMAHYDSVAAAPGAGDDGAGVAALLEIARILQSGAPHRHTVLFAFTDAEEPGMLGAEAFFAEHAWAHAAKVVINLEGSGSDGPVYLLRIGPDSGAVVRAFREVAEYPAAQSFAEEIFKHMPNDTDFSVAMRAGKPGIDFAFAGERNHYHTPLDSIEMLDTGTLQHHGENVLPLVRHLLDADLEDTAPSFVFATLVGDWWITWSTSTGMVLALIGLALMIAATWRVRGSTSAGRLAGGFGLALLVVLAIVAVEVGLLMLTDQLAGARPAWPANPWPWRCVIWAAPVLTLALVARPLARRLGFWPALLGAWWLWSLLAAALAFAAPLAAHLLLPASLIAGALLVLLTFARHEHWIGDAVAVVAAGIAAFLLLPFAYTAEITQGLELAPTVYVPLALVAATLTPLLAAPARADVRLAGWAAAAVAAGGVVWSAIVPVYSALRPQHLVVHYVQDVDAREAHLLAQSPNPLPERIRAAASFEQTETPGLPWEPEGPWNRERASAPAAFLPVLAPELDARNAAAAPTQTADAIAEPGTRDVHLRSRRGARILTLHIPPGATLESFEVNGHAGTAMRNSEDGYLSLTLVNPPQDGFQLKLRFAGTERVTAYLADVGDELPELANAVTEARGTLAVPAHGGDTWIVFRKVTL